VVQEDLKKIIMIVGPTAAGKTAIGIDLAKRFGGEIVNADSGQVWKGLDIGTAKPDAATRAQIPHHLFDVTDPGEHFDASLFVKLADQAIENIIAKGKNPFVVGGTGMYIRMLVHGFCGAPPRNPELRDELAREIEVLGLGALYARLAQIDPATAGVVHSNDRTRIVRALEIFESTGITASEFYRLHRFEELRYKTLKIGLDMPREELYARIDERVDKMMKEGWLREVENLKLRYGEGAQAFSAIGYRELLQHLSGGIPLDEAVNLIKRNSRRFAKRQLTWFRSDHEIKWHIPSQISEIVKETSDFLSNN
jgi:tRNA dimethylallyltransferase